MSVSIFKELLHHKGHPVKVVAYSCSTEHNLPANVAVECTACNEVLFSFDNDEDECIACDEAPSTKTNALQNRLKELQETTGVILAVASLSPTHFGGAAVNWGDLACVDARLSISAEYGQCWEVIIDEASPGAHDLQDFVAFWLAEKGWGQVTVTTQW